MTLHILKSPPDPTVTQIIGWEVTSHADDICLLLLQDAVGWSPPWNLTTYLLAEDAERKNISSPGQIDYATMVELIMKAERVVVW